MDLYIFLILSWTKKIKHPSDFVTVGDSLEVQVLELDVEGRKLNLGHKQTQDNPWDAHEATYSYRFCSYRNH